MILQDYACFLCTLAVDETVTHLFLHCPFSEQAWNAIGLQVPQNHEPFRVLEHFEHTLAVPFFMEIIILWSWSIWKVRNGVIFNNQVHSIQ